jgi:hypothetical protein
MPMIHPKPIEEPGLECNTKYELARQLTQELVEGVETCMDGQPWMNPPLDSEDPVRSRLPFRVKSVSGLQGIMSRHEC